MGTFLAERELWKECGITREEALRRPAREIEEYLFYIQLIRQHENNSQGAQRGR